MEINNFAKKRPHLFWYISDFDILSEEAIIEAVLNNGSWEDVREMIGILGKKKTAAVFKEKSRAKRSNYRPEIKNYFDLYFKKYA
jgi:hypothetical protein